MEESTYLGFTVLCTTVEPTPCFEGCFVVVVRGFEWCFGLFVVVCGCLWLFVWVACGRWALFAGNKKNKYLKQHTKSTLQPSHVGCFPFSTYCLEGLPVEISYPKHECQFQGRGSSFEASANQVQTDLFGGVLSRQHIFRVSKTTF